MNNQILIILSIASVSEQIQELIDEYSHNQRFDPKLREVIFDEVVTEIIYRIINKNPPDKYKNWIHDFSQMVIDVIGYRILMLLHPIVTQNVSLSRCRLKILVTYKEVIIVKTL